MSNAVNTNPAAPVTYTCLATTYRNKKLMKGMSREQFWNSLSASVETVEAAADAGIEEIMAAYSRTGDRYIGPFEVQGPRGVWTHVEGFRSLKHACRTGKTERIVFKTWEEIDAEMTDERVAEICEEITEAERVREICEAAYENNKRIAAEIKAAERNGEVPAHAAEYDGPDMSDGVDD